jgi:hypothetical protein
MLDDLYFDSGVYVVYCMIQEYGIFNACTVRVFVYTLLSRFATYDNRRVRVNVYMQTHKSDPSDAMDVFLRLRMCDGF